jgi:photosynthetic reaction center cytochrome c subunit
VQVLKGIPVDEFMGTMGVFSAALGVSCGDCHAGSDDDWASYAVDNTAIKRTTRRMVLMMANINKTNFTGRQVVTCYSCHRGADRPKTSPNLDTIYGNPPEEESDDFVPQAKGAPTADSILDKYIQALGGAQRLAAITSFTGKGTSSGYGSESAKRPAEVFAKATGQRTTVIHTLNGDITNVYDGRTAWISAPLRPVAVLPLTGGELDGVKLDADVAFPARIKQLFSQWRVGRPDNLHGRRVQVVQGTTAGGTLATFYFDAESGLLLRMVRYANSPVGHMPTQVDYSDYRDVAGVKIPFQWTLAWLDGKEIFEMSQIQANTAIDAARFAKPAPPVEPARPAAR